ncbi:MAG: sugar transferase [Flavobacterium sp.]|nr:sugar transferase [Candidatus Neoflavobacterium equi]
MYPTIKRSVDFITASLAFVFFLPLMICVGLLLWMVNGESPLFFQPRPGKDLRIFHIVKFKTMNSKTNCVGELLSDAERLTALGGLIRKTSLDELPQLYNVIVGDMSLIGPRPLLVQYIPLYNAEQNTRHQVRPGITGWAQVNGRNATSWKEKFALDVFYVNSYNIKLDLKIFLLTIKKVLIKEGISADQHPTVEPFKGNN